jgi:uncharacterized protein YbaR (Trm112 family)
MALDPKLLDILVDPLTKAPLKYDRERQELVSVESALAYPVRDDIPVMPAAVRRGSGRLAAPPLAP